MNANEIEITITLNFFNECYWNREKITLNTILINAIEKEIKITLNKIKWMLLK